MQLIYNLQYLIKCRENNPTGRFFPKSYFYQALDDLIDFYRRGFNEQREQQIQAYRDKVDREWNKFIGEAK